MKADAPSRPEEIELKLALPVHAASSIESKLARTPLLSRRKATHQHLHNVYFDTPEQTLRKKRVALRVRRMGSDDKPKWLQTLKIGGSDNSALSRRGEWEAPVSGAELALHGLAATPWTDIDPDGTVFPALAPCFVTSFDRTVWSVRRRDRSVVEVSLDVGQIVSDNKRAPICELEFELVAGQPAALFDIAQQIARSVAVIPANISKAERGYRLAEDTLNSPVRTQPPMLNSDMSLSDAAQQVLREMFSQFTSNLTLLLSSDDPEVVHQARVGWRRFKSALRLFRPVLGTDAVPSWQPLRPLLNFLGELRDLDVALTETLPPLADVFSAGNALREEKWQTMTQALAKAATLQRKSVRYALMDPVVGATLLLTAQWLEALSLPTGTNHPTGDPDVSLRRWAKRRIIRLHDQLQLARRDVSTLENLHRVRILAKRMRYGIEALRPLLPKQRTRHWYQQATKLQTGLGATRDVMQACSLAAKLDVDLGLVEFLRGFAARQKSTG
jgi:inorganic triphosphatase YgiF